MVLRFRLVQLKYCILCYANFIKLQKMLPFTHKTLFPLEYVEYTNLRLQGRHWGEGECANKVECIISQWGKHLLRYSVLSSPKFRQQGGGRLLSQILGTYVAPLG